MYLYNDHENVSRFTFSFVGKKGKAPRLDAGISPEPFQQATGRVLVQVDSMCQY